MLLKETDTIDAILIMVLEQIKFAILTKLGAPVAMFGFSFVTSVFRVLRVTGKQVTSRKLFAGSRYHLPLRRVIFQVSQMNFFPFLSHGGGSGKGGGTLLSQFTDYGSKHTTTNKQ